tara:strand:+ start:1917 stop:2528 length:612 start_codon:yes stop_codon:yes gene_type:complete
MVGILSLRENYRVGGASGREYDKPYSSDKTVSSPSERSMPTSAVTRTTTSGEDKFAFDDPMLAEKTDYMGETRFGPAQKFVGQSFFNPSGYRNVDPSTGQLKPTFGETISGFGGGIMGLLSGIPGLGLGINYLQQRLKPQGFYDDMSQYNQLGLYGIVPEDYEDEKISTTSFIQQPESFNYNYSIDDIRRLINQAILKTQGSS